MSGQQMLTDRRGLRTTATAAVHKALFQLTHCQESVRLQAVAAANNMSVVSTSLMYIVTLQYEASAEREARDTRTGLAAEPLVIIIIIITPMRL